MKVALGLFAAIVGVVVLVVLIASLMFGLTWLGIEWRGFFGPKRAAVEREVFMETRSYEQGMAQQLARYMGEYKRSETDDERKAIASTVRAMFAEFDPDRIVNDELRSFYKECFE